MGAGLYIDMWVKQKESIKIRLADSSVKQFIQLNSVDFESAGNRKRYSFNLQYENGKVANNIGGSAVARDLNKVLTSDNDIKILLKVGRYKINLNKAFCLWIQKN